MRIRHLLLTIVAAIVMGSCTSDNTNDGGGATIPNGYMAISVDVSAEGYSFASGDCIGLYAVNYNGSATEGMSTTGNQADNAKYSYAGGSGALHRQHTIAIRIRR
jgi:hypothetical protein